MMSQEKSGKGEINISLQEINDFVVRHRGLFILAVWLTIAGLLVFAMLSWHDFKKNACILCEDTGRKCYEPSEPEYNFNGIGDFKRIDNPFKSNIT